MVEFFKIKNDSQILEPVFIVGIDQPISIEDMGKGLELNMVIYRENNF